LRNLHYNASAQEYDIVFNATSSTSSLLVLQFEEKDAPIWIDDLDVHAATMVAVNPDDFIKYLFNYQSSSSTVSLDGTYMDARGNSYSGSITLGAWSSAVLIKQPAAIEVYRALPAMQVGNPAILDAANSFSLYPNPASNAISLALKGSMPAKAPLVLIYSLSGSLKTSFYMNSTTRQVDVTGWSRGMYIVRMVIDGKVQSQKLITL